MVKQGMYKKRSIALYPDLTMRHIGFLGGMPPAVKGLADIKFGEEDEFSEIEEEFMEENKEIVDNIGFETIKEFIQNQRNKIIEQKGLEEANKILPVSLINSINKEIESHIKEEFKEGEKQMTVEIQKQLDEMAQKLEKFSETNSDLTKKLELSEKENKDLKEKMAKFEENTPPEYNENPETLKKLDELTSKLAAAEMKEKINTYKDYVNDLHTSGKVVTECKGTLVDLLVAAEKAGSANFAEGDEVKECTVVEKFKQYLEKQPKLVEFKESVNSDKISKELATEKLDVKAKEVLKRDNLSSYSEALAKAQEENPELAQAAFSEVDNVITE
jgi:hypothetical protein